MERWVLIIGGSSGIGLATAKKLSNKGFKLLIVHRDRRSVLPAFEHELNELSKVTTVHNFNLDATNPEKVEECISAIQEILNGQKVEVIVHSLSRGNLKPLTTKGEQKHLSQQDLNLTFESMGVNLLMWINGLRVKGLVGENSKIITLTSAGSYRYWDSYAAVGIAKAALETMTKYLAVELADSGIRVNTIEAGITDTPSLAMIPGYEDLKSWASKRNPSGRMTQTSDVADAIYLLTLPEAKWINGTIIKVDGGEHLI